MRGPVLAPLALLAACSGAGSSDPQQSEQDRQYVACAVDGKKEFQPVCALERSERGDVVTLVVRHPDGGFRRFDVIDNGRGIAVTDGAQQAVTRYEAGLAEIAVGQDRYRFPIKAPNDAAR